MRRRVVVIASIVVVVLAAGALAWTRISRRIEAPRFRTAEATRGNLIISVSASGTVEPESLVDVRSRATGQVRAVLIEEGDRVQRGQVLVEIDDLDAAAALENAQAALTAARARLAQAEAALAVQRSANATGLKQAEANVAAARARLNQLLFPRAEEIEQAEEGVRQAEAAAALAKQNLARQEQLFADGFIPRSVLDQARNQDEVAQSQLRAARARLSMLRAGGSTQEIEIARAQLRQAEAQLAEARNGVLQERLREQEVAATRAQLQSASAAVRQAQDRVAETRITAPITGVVVKRSVAIGQSVIGGATGGTPVLTLAVTTPVLAKVFVDEVDIARLTSVADVEITTEALPGVTLHAKIVRFAPQPVVQQNVTQYPVTLEIDDPQHQLKLGMTVDAEFVLARRLNIVLVPQEAVRGNESKAVFIVQGTALTPRVVETGLSDGRFAEIVRGVQEGETVYLGPARESPSAPPASNPLLPRFQPRR